MLTEQAQADATYQKHLTSLQGWVGWFALVRGDRLGGIFPTYEAAAAAWMDMYGPVPALIRRIELNQSDVDVAAGPVVETSRRRVDVETITPAEADARLAVAYSWAVAGGRGQEYAA